MNTATVTRDQARRAIDRLERKISEFQNAAYQRGAAVGSDTDPIQTKAAQKADEDARLACHDELERVRRLVENLIEWRDRAYRDTQFVPGVIGGPSL